MARDARGATGVGSATAGVSERGDAMTIPGEGGSGRRGYTRAWPGRWGGGVGGGRKRDKTERAGKAPATAKMTGSVSGHARQVAAGRLVVEEQGRG